MRRIGPDEYAVAALGGKYINDTTPVTGKYKGFFVPSTAVISALEVNGVAQDVKSEYFSAADFTVTGACLITARNRGYFSKITLSSGQAYAIAEYSDAVVA